MHLKGREVERGEETLPCAGSLPKLPQQSWLTRPKTGAMNFIQVSHIGVGSVPSTGTVLCWFHRSIIRKPDWR